ncbi:hypothetical protein FCV25MIE_14345 [Fagus crenata]
MSKKLEVYRGSRRDSYQSDVEELAKEGCLTPTWALAKVAKIASQSALIEHCEISIAYRQPSIAHRGSNKHHRVSTLRS